jgi:HAD superfamily hydrolase (TIGR01509 family)
MAGLLVDSERLERRVWQAAAVEHGVHMSDERFASFIGHPIDECERMLAGYYGASFDVIAYRATCHRHMRAVVDAEGLPLRPGALEWLAFVTELGIPLGVATSSGPALVQERLGSRLHVFAAVVTRADVVRGKPNPDLYLEAAARLGAEPAACLALEDSPTGARAAIAAAMPVIIVPDMVTPPADIARATAGVYESLDAVRAAAGRAWGQPDRSDPAR